MEDQQIVDLYWRRDADAIGETASKYGGYCRTIAQNILSDRQDAEECLNDTWMGAWNAMPPHRPSRLGLFLGKITRNLAWDTVRARTARKRGGDRNPNQGHNSPENQRCGDALPQNAARRGIVRSTYAVSHLHREPHRRGRAKPPKQPKAG